jgi:hypothetical protein
VNQIADGLGWNAQRLNLIDQRRYDLMMGIYGEGNKSVAQTYLGRDDLFRDPFVDRPVTTFDVDEYTTDELIAMAQEMAVKSLYMLKMNETNVQELPLMDQIAFAIKARPALKKRLMPIIRMWQQK